MKKKKATPITVDTDDIVKVENLKKVYDTNTLTGFTAVRKTSFTVKRGEFVAVVGTSGSGKSTLIHMLGGVEKPSEGKVYICGNDIYEMDDAQLSVFRCSEIGMVFQFFNLIPVLNVEENIAFPLIAAGKEPDFDEIEELVIKLGLDGHGTYLPNQLSGGQQQRVAIGRAIIANPSLILADEPTGNLDSKNSREVIDLLENLCREMNKTLIIITHDESIAARADRIMRIEDGKIISDTKSVQPILNN